MKITFSTLGCPEWNWEDIYSMAKDIGFDGIELRGVGGEICSYKARPFTAEEIGRTIQKMQELGLSFSAISSSCCVKNDYFVQKTMADGLASIDLAARLGARYVRILGDLEPFETAPVDEDTAVRALLELSDYAAPKKVVLLVETNGYYADSKHLKDLMQRIGRDNVAVLWDVHHPARYRSLQIPMRR